MVAVYLDYHDAAELAAANRSGSDSVCLPRNERSGLK
jgi:hypothetical protein